MAVGCAAKCALLVAYDLFHPPMVGTVLTTYDPLGVPFASAVLGLFFDMRGIAPPPAAACAFEVLLIFAFAGQCFILGLVISEGFRRLRSA
jgi:hypothetical protein